jgi:hypothetical protein
MRTIVDTLYFKGESNRYGMLPRLLVRTRGLSGHSRRTVGCGPARERGGGRGLCFPLLLIHIILNSLRESVPLPQIRFQKQPNSEMIDVSEFVF